MGSVSASLSTQTLNSHGTDIAAARLLLGETEEKKRDEKEPWGNTAMDMMSEYMDG